MNKPLVYGVIVLVIVAGSFLNTARTLPLLPERLPLHAHAGIGLPGQPSELSKPTAEISAEQGHENTTPGKSLQAGGMPRGVLFLFPVLMALLGALILVPVNEKIFKILNRTAIPGAQDTGEEKRIAFYPLVREIVISVVLCLELLLTLAGKAVTGPYLGRYWDRYDWINLVFIMLLAVFFFVAHSTKYKLLAKADRKDGSP